MSELKYDPSFLDIIRKITAINNRVVIKRDSDVVRVRAMDSEYGKGFFFYLAVPAEQFDVAEKISFFDYREFYDYFKFFNTPSLSYDDVNVSFNEGKVNTRYRVKTTKAVVNEYPKFDPEKLAPYNVEFTISKDQIIQLKKMINLQKSKRSCIEFDGTNIIFKVYNDYNDYKLEILPDAINDAAPFEYTISSNVLVKFPLDAEYKFRVKRDIIATVDLMSCDEFKDLSLQLFISQSKEIS